ncbi:universal stress protein [Thermus thermamylovorans]|uniref:Universal stress protein n=1 Tax=Thermus thermamylovorans TaxID=2509362 RepID=A0A4V2IVD2_9DEIN|nr:universal stress protein [Thermus thermamylovorans]TBH21880.1 universal stress protein [Thermus thermamylovorans]
MYRTLLLPTDGSQAAEKGLQEGLRLAKLLGAQATFLHVLEPLGPRLLLGPETLPYYGQLLEEQRKAAKEALARAQAEAEALGVACRSLLREGRAAEVIRGLLEEHDLLVLASHGRTGLDLLLLGSVTHEVLRRARKPVLVVPYRAKER